MFWCWEMWRGLLSNEAVHQGCVLHIADLALYTVWLNKCNTLCLKLLNHQCCACGSDFFVISLFDVSVGSLKFVENLTLSESLLNWKSCCFPARYSMNPLAPVIYWNIAAIAQSIWWLATGWKAEGSGAQFLSEPEDSSVVQVQNSHDAQHPHSFDG